MSIISANKEANKEAREAYAEIRKERDALEARRKLVAEQNRKLRETNRELDRNVIETMLSIETGEGMSAKDIAIKMGGAITIGEVIANLTAILRTDTPFEKKSKKYNKYYFGVWENRHGVEPTRITKGTTEVVRWSLPCDEDGNVLEGASPVPHVTKKTVYRFYKKNEYEFFPTVGGML